MKKLKSIKRDSKEFDELSKEDQSEWFSQKVFNKKSKDVKYLLVTNHIHKNLLEEELTRTGLYQWLNVFNGEVLLPRDVVDYNDYDIIQINMSLQDVPLLQNIKSMLKKGSKTKIVLNNDYTTELWGGTFGDPNTLGREVRDADMLFGTEYYQTTALTELTGRKCFVIPHPADVKRLKSLKKRPIKDTISTIWRRYDKFYYLPSLVCRNHGVTTQIIGVNAAEEPKVWAVESLFDYALSGTNFFDFCDMLRESKVVYDPFTFHSYNRAMVDCASMGVAVVGSNRTQSVNVCYPYTAVDPYDITTARKLIDRLLNDEEFYKKVVTTALEKSEYYNHKNSKLRYYMALYEAQEE